MKPLAMCNSIVSVLLVFFLLFSPKASAAEEKDCKCWEEFQVEKEGDQVHCRGIKNHRIFPCNEEKPPLCVCNEKTDSKEVTLDLGETSCISVENKYKDINCKPEKEWGEYLDRHPQYRIYH